MAEEGSAPSSDRTSPSPSADEAEQWRSADEAEQWRSANEAEQWRSANEAEQWPSVGEAERAGRAGGSDPRLRPDGAGDPSADDEPDDPAGFLDEHGYLAWLGVRIESAEDGRAVMRVPYDETLLNPGSGGTVHGGVAATLIDTASAVALRSTFEDPAAARMATTDLHVNYLRPARDDLVAEAAVVRAGGSIGVTDVTVTSTTPEGEEKAVAVGRTTYRLFR